MSLTFSVSCLHCVCHLLVEILVPSFWHTAIKKKKNNNNRDQLTELTNTSLHGTIRGRWLLFTFTERMPYIGLCNIRILSSVLFFGELLALHSQLPSVNQTLLFWFWALDYMVTTEIAHEWHGYLCMVLYVAEELWRNSRTPTDK